MARRKRLYVPKIKGCYECSQRRIDCDGTRPSCTKCTSRGFECSGFGVKFKFRDGFSGPRKATNGNGLLNGSGSGSGKEAKRSQPRPNSEAGSQSATSPSARKPQTRQTSHETSELIDDFATLIDASPFDLGLLHLDGGLPDSLPLISLPFPPNDWTMLLDDVGDGNDQENSEDARGNGDSDNDGDGIGASVGSDNFDVDGGKLGPRAADTRTHQALILTNHSYSPYRKLSVTPDLALMDSWKQFLVTYFSDHIAPEMVVVDDKYNGWRQCVLPSASADDLVMCSVLAVSAFHLNGRLLSQNVADPNRLYAKAIRELQNRKDLATCDKQTKQLVILAIVVLLVAVMVNGCSDFPILFYMLESALQASGGEDGLLDEGELAEFSRRQIHKMRVYAAPLLSQDQGLQAIMCQAKESFDCLHYYVGLHPEHSSAFSLLADLRQQAFNIYLNRVLTRGETPQAAGLIDQFVSTIQSFPEGSPGENVLVWPVFIAASESISPEHQCFFIQFLERHYQRNGFGNILKALDLLKKIWSRDDAQNWPALLPEPQVFIM